jgi:hypothetical protein
MEIKNKRKYTKSGHTKSGKLRYKSINRLSKTIKKRSLNKISNNLKRISKRIKNTKTYKNLSKRLSKTFLDNNVLDLNLSDSSISFIIRSTARKFHSRTYTARHIKRPEFEHDDKLVEYIDDNLYKLRSNQNLSTEKLDTIIMNHSVDDCVCELVYNKTIPIPNAKKTKLNKLKNIKDIIFYGKTNKKVTISKKCNCKKLSTYKSQGRSGSEIFLISCNNKNNSISDIFKSTISQKDIINNNKILKITNINNHFIKIRTETNNYIYIEFDKFTLETIIGMYINKELPNNSIKIINSGICNKYLTSNRSGKIGYNLMKEANLDNGLIFLFNLLKGKYDEELNITTEDIRYTMVTSFLLQAVLIIGHLHSCSLEFFHGDYKPENLLVKKSNTNRLPFFIFNIFGKEIKVRNMGFAVMISDFDKSSITLNSNINITKPRKQSHSIKHSIRYSGKLYDLNTSESNSDDDNNYSDDNDDGDDGDDNDDNDDNDDEKINNKLKDYFKKDSKLDDIYNDITDNHNAKKYRLISPILLKPILGRYVNDIIKKYGDIDPNTYKEDIVIDKLFISKLIPRKKDPTISIIRAAGVKVYRDFDLYIFFIKLLEHNIIREYLINNKIDKIIMSFMSQKFKDYLLSLPPRAIGINETGFLIVEILHKINEPLKQSFDDTYIKVLNMFNYHLFDNY